MSRAPSVSRPAIVRLISQKMHLPPHRVSTVNNLQQLGLDPYDVVELIWILEKRFRISIPDEVPLKTVEDFVCYIDAQRMPAAQTPFLSF
jgi:acyl carrier protein